MSACGEQGSPSHRNPGALPHFQEVEQPESEFVFRVYDDRSISLTAADGGMWKLAARDAVKHYLEIALCDEITAGKVKVTL